MNSVLCEACIRKPGGIEGHHGLVLDLPDASAKAASPAVLFACSHCTTRWWRTYMGDGNFLWAAQETP